MDSGNTSGSMQSSSGGGDEEYDSRAAAASDPTNNSFLTNQTQPTMLFDPSNLPNFFNHQQPPSLEHHHHHHHHNMVWPPRPVIRSDPVHSDLLIPQTQQPPPRSTTQNISIPTLPTPNDTNGAVVRNPKKRSRASRRAPTTVLTTDTTNFRAMVQEFTGIPAPPFNATSPFPRTRLDLFGSGSGSRSGFASLDHHNLLRPFAHKVQAFPQQTTIPPFVVPSNQALGFNHSVLQAPQKIPILPLKSNNNSVLEDQFGLSQVNNSNNNNPFATNWVGVGGGNNNEGIILGSNDNINSANDSNNHGGSADHEGFLRSINGGGFGGNSTAITSEQVITSTSNGKTTPDFHVSTNKTTENNSSNINVVGVARSEGMVESWICSSD